jgi:putative transposase
MLDDTFEQVRENGRVIVMAVLIAVGVKSTEERDVVGVEVGPAKDVDILSRLSRELAGRRLTGVHAVIPRSQAGSRRGADRLDRPTWPSSCANALATVPKSAQQMVAATLRRSSSSPTPSPPTRDGVYDFLMVAKPLYVVGGIGSPANAIAITWSNEQ